MMLVALSDHGRWLASTCSWGLGLGVETADSRVEGGEAQNRTGKQGIRNESCRFARRVRFFAEATSYISAKMVQNGSDHGLCKTPVSRHQLERSEGGAGGRVTHTA